MKVLSVYVRNFAGISEADIKPGKVTIFSGRNRQGKTSLLNAVRVCLEGGDPTMIHQGTDKAEIVVDLEEIRVAREITVAKSSVNVTDPKGFKLPRAPQTYLSTLLGTTQFNPMEFHRAKKADRTKMLLEAIAKKVTFDEIVEITGEVVPGIPKEGPALVMFDLVRRHYYALRAAKNKELVNRRELARTARAKVPEGYKPDELLDEKMKAVTTRREVLGKKIATLQAEKKATEQATVTRTKLEDRIRKNEGILASARTTLAEEKIPDIGHLRGLVEDLRIQLRAAEEALQYATSILANRDRLESDIAAMEKAIAQDKETLAALPGTFDESILSAAAKDLDELLTESASIEAEKARQRIWNEYVILRDEAVEAEEESGRLSALCERFGNDLPAQAVREAKLPITGLALSGEKITVEGKPLDDLSTAEQVGVTSAIARSLAEELKVICIDGWERLDEKTRAEYIRQTEEDGFYYFVTRVGEPKPGEIEIKEGKVA